MAAFFGFYSHKLQACLQLQLELVMLSYKSSSLQIGLVYGRAPIEKALPRGEVSRLQPN